MSNMIPRQGTWDKDILNKMEGIIEATYKGQRKQKRQTTLQYFKLFKEKNDEEETRKPESKESSEIPSAPTPPPAYNPQTVKGTYVLTETQTQFSDTSSTDTTHRQAPAFGYTCAPRQEGGEESRQENPCEPRTESAFFPAPPHQKPSTTNPLTCIGSQWIGGKALIKGVPMTTPQAVAFISEDEEIPEIQNTEPPRQSSPPARGPSQQTLYVNYNYGKQHAPSPERVRGEGRSRVPKLEDTQLWVNSQYTPLPRQNAGSAHSEGSETGDSSIPGPTPSVDALLTTMTRTATDMEQAVENITDILEHCTTDHMGHNNSGPTTSTPREVRAPASSMAQTPRNTAGGDRQSPPRPGREDTSRIVRFTATGSALLTDIDERPISSRTRSQSAGNQGGLYPVRKSGPTTNVLTPRQIIAEKEGGFYAETYCDNLAGWCDALGWGPDPWPREGSFSPQCRRTAYEMISDGEGDEEWDYEYMKTCFQVWDKYVI